MSTTHSEQTLVSDRFRAQCEKIVSALKLDQAGPIEHITALRGAGSSDIALVSVGGAQICIKCAPMLWPFFDKNEQALQALVEATETNRESRCDRVVIYVDVTAPEYGHNGRYRLALDNPEKDSHPSTKMPGRWLERFPIASIKRPLAKDQVAGMRAFTKCYGENVRVIGDDSLVSNAKLDEQALIDQACTVVLVEVNQTGTVSEALDAMQTAQRTNWTTVVSARSGETEDASICHLATGPDSGQFKVGSFARSARMIKWNECLRIGHQIKNSGLKVPFAGAPALANTGWGRNQAVPS